MNVFGEDLGYCICRDRVKRRLTTSQFRSEVARMHDRCASQVRSEWTRLSGLRHPPNPLGHPQPRALDFHDIVYIAPGLVGQSLEQITFELGTSTGFCACDRQDEYEDQHLNGFSLTAEEWSRLGNSFFDRCRASIAADWITAAARGHEVPQGLPAPSRPVTPRPDFPSGLNWILHPLGLGPGLRLLNFKRLAAAASKVRRKVWRLGKEEGVLLRGLER
ncbi:MAG: hypothetical protein M1826_000058 [Phylliscum demangeonii]|nr:MAG: hypothetical protein M1826_000058 [Phylliscum demangeonii]